MLPFTLCFQRHLPHKLLDGLMVDVYSVVVKLGCNTPISVSPMMLIVYSTDTIPDGIVTIGLSKAFSVVVVC